LNGLTDYQCAAAKKQTYIRDISGLLSSRFSWIVWSIGAQLHWVLHLHCFHPCKLWTQHKYIRCTGS